MLRQALGLVGKANESQYVRNAAADLLAGDVCHPQREGNVVINIHIRNQPEILKHNAERPAVIRHLAPLHAHKILTVDVHLAGRRLFLAHHQLDKRAFPRARRADNEYKLPSVNAQTEIVERMRPRVFIHLGDIDKLDHWYTAFEKACFGAGSVCARPINI